MARKRATDLSKNRYDELVLIVLLVILAWQYYSAPVNIMAEYVSATLPIILKSSFLQQLWAL